MGVMADWYQDFGAHDVFLAASGPKEWQRVKVNKVATESKTVGADVQVDTAARGPLAAGPVVSGIQTSDNRITFDVDRVGVPVLVKASYFPNWKVAGASGPYRVSPNLMVVIPDVEARQPLLRLDAGRLPRLDPHLHRHRAGRAWWRAGARSTSTTPTRRPGPRRGRPA